MIRFVTYDIWRITENEVSGLKEPVSYTHLDVYKRQSTSRVAPFGNLGIKGYLHLPQAYRSLSRPSSPPRAKASTVCPRLLSVSLTPVPFLLLKLKTVSD